MTRKKREKEPEAWNIVMEGPRPSSSGPSEDPRPEPFTVPIDRTFTLTFGDQAENHHGMQKIGSLAEDGFDLEDLGRACNIARSAGCAVDLYSLNDGLSNTPEAGSCKIEGAYFLIIRNGVALFGPDLGVRLYREQEALPHDTMALMRGRVVNKRARHNLCFGPQAQEPKYEEGRGRILAYSQVPALETIRSNLHHLLGPKAVDLVVEGNYYYDISKCGIGYHGDTERRKVVGLRLGASLPLHFHWFHRSLPVGSLMPFLLHHGDLYIMSTKTTGYDWKRSSLYTLRHAAGSSKFLTLPVRRKTGKKEDHEE